MLLNYFFLFSGDRRGRPGDRYGSSMVRATHELTRPDAQKKTRKYIFISDRRYSALPKGMPESNDGFHSKCVLVVFSGQMVGLGQKATPMLLLGNRFACLYGNKQKTEMPEGIHLLVR